ncbi:MAG: 2-amino-4-hydroxy-6-hydroxymethyldihydropteridine diphosphokinase [Alphaproteobacteria bacterium]|nr:2-amino-4-hydroxy-6-hydroxymethyldihydropteridine diphosphokinase [Alphaproteobacteria bacterium]MDE2042530.1 2-amino-4-hydroxy-6-hydroxymethyldihydropteridine diphosphokinase [Alphaproteobacteria bacterium]MDE2340930.1 2-amino-4-hydroxy-6-hydroxymethyldihydropteridine diphosphokinase [Alphaproteobacteria bacterium]
MISMRYGVALGSNQRHARFGCPCRIIDAAFRVLDKSPFRLIAASSIDTTLPVGPSQRRYANAAALIETALMPDDLLRSLQKLEAEFGRKRRGQRWRSRTLDLDILFWSEGVFVGQDLVIPHRDLRHRSFVLAPLTQIAPQWRDPLTGLSARQLSARLDRARSLP